MTKIVGTVDVASGELTSLRAELKTIRGDLMALERSSVSPKEIVALSAIGGTLDAANTWTYGDDQDEARKQGWSYQFVPGGLMLTLGLRDPGKEVGMMGDLTIRWQTAGVIPLPTLTGGQELLRLLSAKPVAKSQVDQEEGDPQILQKFAKLSAADRKVFVDRQRAAAVPVHHAKPVRIAPTQTLNSAPQAAAVPTAMLDHGKMVQSAPESREQQTADAKKRAAAESYLKERGVQ